MSRPWDDPGVVDGFPKPDDDLTVDMRTRVETELVPSERLIWAGRARHRVPRFDLWIGSGVALLALGGWLFSRLDFGNNGNQAAFSAMNVATFGGVVVSWAGGFILLMVGLIKTTVARVASRENARTLYALTDRRALAWRPAATGGTEVRSYWPDQVEGTSRIDRSDGRGDVVFVLSDRAAGAPLGMANLFILPSTVGHGFFGIGNPRRVEGLVREALIDRRDYASH